MRAASRLVLRTAVLLVSLLAGCGSVRDWLRSPEQIATEAISERRFERDIVVALVGGDDLNADATGVARPVQVCVYLSDDPRWAPGPWPADGSCRRAGNPADGDGHVIGSERRLLAAREVEPVTFRLGAARAAWIVVDVDYALRAPDYAPLRLPVAIGGAGFSAAWLGAQRVVAARSAQ